MKDKDYVIFRLNDGGLYVIILSHDIEDPYWDSLKCDISVMANPGSFVRFDYLLRNGMSNRFFTTILEGTNLRANSLRRAKIDSECESISKAYFRQHPDLISGSVLTPLQKKAFLAQRKEVISKYNSTSVRYQISRSQALVTT